MVNEIEFRPYKKGDEKKIVDFLQIVFNKWPNFDFIGSALEHWRWKFQDPSSVTVAEIDGKIVATFHSIPIEVKVGNDVISSCQGVDVAVHPDYQGKGIYTQIRDRCYEIRLNNGILMHYGITAHPKLIAKRKQDEKTNKETFPTFPHTLYEYIYIKDPEKYFQNNNVNAVIKKTGLKMLKLLHKKHTKKYVQLDKIKINEINRFDEKINTYWNEIKDSYKFSIVKNMNFLNWRYCDERGGNFDKFIATDEKNKICGYVVTRINRFDALNPRGHIADLSYNTRYPKIGGVLLDHALNFFNANNINSVQAFAFKDSEIESLYKQRPFIKQAEPYLTITIFSDISSSLKQLEKSNQDEMHFSMGDLDWI
jgi:hypothetical protein